MLDLPQSAPPIWFDRHRQFGQIAPFSVRQVIDALLAPLHHAGDFLGLTQESADLQTRSHIVVIEQRQFIENALELDLSLRERFDCRLEATFPYQADAQTPQVETGVIDRGPVERGIGAAPCTTAAPSRDRTANSMWGNMARQLPRGCLPHVPDKGASRIELADSATTLANAIA